MAKTRASSRRPKSALDRERYTAELTTMQLVIGMCLLLTFGLGCFLLGVLIGKFDPSLREQTAAESADGTISMPAQTPPEREAVAQTTRPAETATALPPEIRPPQNLVGQDRPSPSSSAQETPPQSGPPATDSNPDITGRSSVVTPAEPEVTQPEPPKPATAPENTPAPTAPERVEISPPPAQPLVVATPPKTTPGGNFGVQIIAVARAKAERVKRDVEAKTKYKAEIIPIDGDRLCKVVVGRFGDRQAADTTRTEMRTTYGYKDAFVIVLQ